MRIDAHQHVWATRHGDYGWLTPASGPLWRDFGPADLKPLLDAGGIDGTVLVQAAPTEAETRRMLAVAADTPWVLGVVGWTDFAGADAPDRIAALAADPLLVGLRPMIQDIPDPEWMLGAALAPAFDAVEARGLAFDALVKPPQLGALRRLLARRPGLRVVVDHGAKPAIGAGPLDQWAADMADIATDSAAWCKLSGLVTEAGPGWTVETLRPAVDHLLDCFGPDRLIWGSDWPVCTLAAGYADWLAATDALLAGLDAGQRAAVMGGNAARFYGLSPRA